ncbi:MULTISPECIES: biotin--[acetyl-CoA-carboxylase] ligase [unclassified Acinetobacter]|jgi:BirA family biotin operon repressor/biotin-[acetyl-CoA-carboxylase] ligase|uniref:biotin--[acetyl-CoA-carboxylase] ligase n=1 Tax=unclassified Acinetobacter TaxID=196816 RepID=UPI0015D19B69|nr:MULTISPECIES: biotin--[acetyl-CoA-carboxylase] ligase [unclassified Acinetobacter]QQN38788.1 biotin--[acetyl-CoA-carboxylase] ligase [Acinetobacter sp. CS-2]
MDLETRQLQKILDDAHQLPEVLLLKPVTTSTNDDVREIALKGVHSVLVCSSKQTQGRGQRQRQWVSPEGNIYLSTLLNTRTAIDGRLALEIALNILQMPSLQDLDLQVKWPNDLYSRQGKWGGILVEPISPHQVIVGVGINLEPVLKAQIDQHATSVRELGLQDISRIQLIAELYMAIQQASAWFDHDCYNLAARFNHYAAFINQAVEFEDHSGVCSGIFQGIQDDGSVNIDTPDGLKQFYQGRLRRLSTSL